MNDWWRCDLCAGAWFNAFGPDLVMSMRFILLSRVFVGGGGLQRWRRHADHVFGNPVRLLLVFISRSVDRQFGLDNELRPGSHRGPAKIVDECAGRREITTRIQRLRRICPRRFGRIRRLAFGGRSVPSERWGHSLPLVWVAPPASRISTGAMETMAGQLA